MQENNGLMAIKSLIAMGTVVFFVVPPASNKLAFSASSNTLEALNATYRIAKEGGVGASPSLLVKNKRLANR